MTSEQTQDETTERAAIIRDARERANSWTLRARDAAWVYEQAQLLARGDLANLVSEVLHHRLQHRVAYWPSAVETGEIVRAALATPTRSPDHAAR